MNNDTRRIRREVIAALAQGGERQDDPIITAQHDETGRMVTGPRSQIPRRYAECSPAAAQEILEHCADAIRTLAREAEQEGSK